MPRPKSMLALATLALIMLVGCHETADLPNTDVHAATTQTVYCYAATTDDPSGHIDGYQDWLGVWSFDWSTSTITRAFYYYQIPYIDPPAYDTMRAYPRKSGFCRFIIPGFNWTGDLPVCTLFYYQSAHNGSPDLRVNAWLPSAWPPDGAYKATYFWRIWNSTDTVATDGSHANDDSWYGAPLTYWGTCAIADSGSKYYGIGGGATADFYTGWIYPSYSPSHGQNGWYADVSGSGDYRPYIKVVYEPGP